MVDPRNSSLRGFHLTDASSAGARRAPTRQLAGGDGAWQHKESAAQPALLRTRVCCASPIGTRTSVDTILCRRRAASPAPKRHRPLRADTRRAAPAATALCSTRKVLHDMPCHALASAAHHRSALGGPFVAVGRRQQRRRWTVTHTRPAIRSFK